MITVGDNCDFIIGKAADYSKETDELASFLNLTRPQDKNYDNMPYISIGIKLISLAQKSHSLHIDTEKSSNISEYNLESCFENAETEFIARFIDNNSETQKIKNAFQLTWRPEHSDSETGKLFVSLWSPKINKDDPFGETPELSEAFYLQSDADAQGNNTKYPYLTASGSAKTYDNDCNRITVFIRKNGDLSKLIRFIEGLEIL